ncbi:3-oxoacyl-[acyl-carrier-protein] reductase FabG [Buchnera aphidicola (Eriosoma lanigerum)]
MKNQVALITGANRGIGKAIAIKLKEKVQTIIGTSTTQKGVDDINKLLKNHGKGILLNIKNHLSIQSELNKIYDKFGNIDIIINNAGINHDHLLINTSIQEWEDTIQTNLTSIFYITKTIIKKMIKRRTGRIITIGSMIGYTGNIGQISYATSKSALVGFHKSLALEVANKGITVNIIAPGVIDSGMTKKLRINQKKKYLSQIPMKRLGTSDDIANAVVFLSSDQSSYITGHTLHINGGMYMM